MRITMKAWGMLLGLVAIVSLAGSADAHVTLQTSQPLRPNTTATVVMNVPNERTTDTTKVTLQVPRAFLNAGGRLSRVVFPPGWTVTFEKEDKPEDVLAQENAARAKRSTGTAAATGDHDVNAGTSEAAAKEKQAMDEMRKKWITKVTFSGGVIPPDGFQQFQISFQLPEQTGAYRFSSVQSYADGVDVSWSEFVEGAAHPAPALAIQKAPAVNYSDLPLPMSGLALLLAVIGILRSSKSKEVRRADTAASTLAGTNRLANV